MLYEILNAAGEVEGTIVASEAFVREHHPDRWRLASDVEMPSPLADPTAWLIDTGPFFDRFGAAKMAVLTSADPGVKAILADTQVRKWIDLQRPDVAQSVGYIASVVAAVTPELQAAILTTPVAHDENLALRKLYFS